MEPRSGSSPAAYDAILGELLEGLELGLIPSLEELRGRWPGEEELVERAHEAVSRYVSLRGKALLPTKRGFFLRPGDTLGDFEIESALARGGMGVVYRARQRSLGKRLVALKVLPIEGQSEHALARFEREALAASGVHHPHLAEIYGFGREKGVLFYAMRFIEGPTLQVILERLAAKPELAGEPAVRRRIVERASEVASALAALHREGLVHRDVKPSNVLLERDEEGVAVPDAPAVLVDLGLIRPIDLDTLTRTQLGAATLAYASPEQLLGQDVGPSTDVFSLGVMLHDILCGRLPDARPQPSAGLEPLEELLPGVECDLAAIVAKATDPVVRWRYPDAERLHADLVAWLEGRAVSARKPVFHERAVRWLDNRRARIFRGLALVGFVVLVALAAIAVYQPISIASSAREARARQDFAALGSALGQLPGFLAPLVLRDDSLEELARRLREDSDPLRTLHTRLVEGDVEAGIEEAAVSLARSSDPDADPWLREIFLWHLTGPSNDGGRLAALRMLARLSYEREHTEAELEDTETQRAFHHASLRLFEERDSLGRDELRYLLTALSGFAEAQDLDDILAWSAARGTFSDEQRLGILAVERSLRRLQRMAQLADVDFLSLWESAATCSRAFGWDPVPQREVPHGSHVALDGLLISLAAASRAAGAAIPLPSFLPVGWRIEDVPPRQFRVLFAAAGQPSVRLLLVDEGPGEESEDWGLMCGLLGDEAFAERVRGRCGPSFEIELAEGRRRLDGVYEEVAPDPDALLGAEVPDTGLVALELVPDEEPVEQDPDLVAQWDFQRHPPRWVGQAGPVQVRLAHQSNEDSEYYYLRMAAFGRSEVRLSFEVDRVQSPELILWEQKSAQRYYPLQGEVQVEIFLDDVIYVSSKAVTTEGPQHVIPIPADLLQPGKHVLSIRLGRESTTPYWLHKVALRGRR